MKVTVTTEHIVTFIVEYHERQEGGMDHEYFGRDFDSLDAAIRQLEIARATRPDRDWYIHCDVETKASSK